MEVLDFFGKSTFFLGEFLELFFKNLIRRKFSSKKLVIQDEGGGVYHDSSIYPLVN